MSTVPAAAASGNQRKALEALRDRLAGAIDSVDDIHLAGLARELKAVLAELASLPLEAGGTVVDDLNARRAARRAAAKSS